MRWRAFLLDFESQSTEKGSVRSKRRLLKMGAMRTLIISLLLVVLILYVSSSLVCSRRGFADADRYGMAGFYFFHPEPTDEWRRRNYGFVYFYYPLIHIDRWLGTGRAPAGEPLWNLS